MTAFRQPASVWNSLSRWVGTNSFPAAQDSAFRSMIADAAGTEAAQEWRAAVVGGLNKAAEAQGTSFTRAFWRWIECAPPLVTTLWPAISKITRVEERLVGSAPLRLEPKTVQPLVDFAMKERLYLLHAAIVSAVYSPAEAVRHQLKIAPLDMSDTIRLALRSASPRDVVACAAETADPRLIVLAAEAVSTAPTLLVDFDLSTDVIRTIWASALERNLEAWRGPASPRVAFDALLLDLLDGRSVASELLDRLAHTPLADLSDFSRRSEVWSKVNLPTRDNLLRATARGWLDKVTADLPVLELDAQLQTAVLQDQQLDQLLGQLSATDRLESAVRTLAYLSMFPEGRFTAWLRSTLNRIRNVSPSAAGAIGRLIEQRRWRNATDELMHTLRWSGRNDLRPALRECASMVSVFDRWVYGLSPITPVEKWEALENLAADLYPSGPDHDGLWERADGYNADLPWGSSGRTRWRDALTQIRRGGKGPKMGKLLREIQRDFPANTSLRFLAEEREFSRY